ncbi:hypothetical protein JMUB6875_20880 [Nocardia sp. JMUB6875]
MGTEIHDRPGRLRRQQPAHGHTAPDHDRPQIRVDEFQYPLGPGRIQRRIPKHRRIVDPPGQIPGPLRTISRPLGNLLQRRIPHHNLHQPRIPAKVPGIALDNHDRVPTPHQSLDDRSADPPAASGNNIRSRHHSMLGTGSHGAPKQDGTKATAITRGPRRVGPGIGPRGRG